ncbi:MAG: class I SAM-dependent rRNA methyltransferase, partial [Bacteroidales bacterium]|nr:class I SAM-dependent rRNA methyltransferase [Bacteroidales bacterium]
MHGKIILKRGKDQSLLRFHPWVFSGAVAKIEGDPQNGDTVEVYSSDRNLLGKGHFQKGSI